MEWWGVRDNLIEKFWMNCPYEHVLYWTQLSEAIIVKDFEQCNTVHEEKMGLGR